MPNWFKRIQDVNTLEDKARWLFSVEASVWVPTQIDQEEEKETAKHILSTVLNQVEGDASLHTAIESNVKFDIQFDPIKQ